MLGIGALIGGGIFSVLGILSVVAGPYSYLSYLFTGLLSLFTVYSYMKLTLRFGNTCGGEYSLIQQAFNGRKQQRLNIYTGIILYFGNITTMGLYAYTFAIYFIHLLGINEDWVLEFDIIFLIFIFIIIINALGVKNSAIAENILVMIKIIILLLFSICGIYYAFCISKMGLFNLGFHNGTWHSFNPIGILIGSGLIIVSYQGFQLISNACLEMKDREKGIKTMNYAQIISMLIYIYTTVATVAALGVEGIIGETDRDAEIAIANAANLFMGNYGKIIISIGALFSTLSALNATLLGTSRLAFMMSFDNIFSARFSKISDKYHVPTNSIIITGILSAFIAVTIGGALGLAALTDLIFAQVFIIINYTNFKAYKETKSKKIISLLGFFSIIFLVLCLMIYLVFNFKDNWIAIILFVLMQIISVFLMKKNGRKLTLINNQ